MSIIGYTYDNGTHCVQCTQQRARSTPGFGRIVHAPLAWRSKDENFLRMDLLDSKWNPVRPVYSTSGAAYQCIDCKATLGENA